MTPPAKAPAKKAAAKKSPAKKSPVKAAPRKAPVKRPTAAARQAAETERRNEAAYDAHQLKLTGLPWREVARLSGYASEVSAQLAVQAYLQRAVLEESRERRQMALQAELDLLDLLQQPYFNQATHGDLDAANFILKVSQQRAKLRKLDAPEEGAVTSQTIVITGSSEEYIGQLKRLVLPDQPQGITGSSPVSPKIIES